MCALVFSYAYYNVKDFEKAYSFFRELNDKELFVIDESKKEKKEITGTCIRDYPKGHWNAPVNNSEVKQVIGGAEIKEGILKIDTKSKEGLKELGVMLEKTLGEAIEFDRVEFKDVMNMFGR